MDHQRSTYLTAPQVRARFGGRSDTWLFRLLKAGLDFPKPMKLRGRRYWKLVELQKWEQSQADRVPNGC